MKKITLQLLATTVVLLCVAHIVIAQPITHSSFSVSPPAIINFKALAQQEKLNPPQQPKIEAERDEQKKERFIMRMPVPPHAAVTRIQLPNKMIPPTTSPAPVAAFTGLIDNNYIIPPDVEGVAGSGNIMEALNSAYAIFSKSGSIISSLTINGFWSGITNLSGTPFDQRIQYDAINNRWILTADGTISSGDWALFIAVSQTPDPTGNWYEYYLDTGSSSTLPDFPTLGYNNNWVVMTVNDFGCCYYFTDVKTYVLNRAALYSGTLGTVNAFTDASGIASINPAITLDPFQNTEYMLADYNGNSSGNGYLRIFTITGSANAPVYTAGNTIGVNQPWSDYYLDASQKGSSYLINTDDDRMHSTVFRDGFLWGTHHVYLPAASPNHVSVDAWQIDPVANTVSQFIRIDDPTAATNYYYPSIAINASHSIIIGYSLSGTNDYVSSAYSYHDGSDGSGVIQSPYIFQAGLATYFKDYGSGRNRWGDYSETSLDPVDQSFWTCQEFANTPANEWATSWANINPSPSACGIPGGLAASNVDVTTATLSWNAISNANSYNVRYRPYGSNTWVNTSTTSTSVNITGLSPDTQYEFEVQSVCSAGTGNFSGSAYFTTLPVCGVPSGLSSSNITASTATLSWSAVPNATQYNVQYRPVGTTTWSSVMTASPSVNVTSLQPSTTYEFQVQAQCPLGWGSFSLTANFTTLVACDVVTGLKATNITTSSATLSWTPVVNATSYNVQYRISGTSVWTNTSTNKTKLTVSNLITSTTYEFQVQGICPLGPSLWSASATFKTKDACGTPTGLRASNITTTSASLSWQPVSGASDYNLQYRKTGSTAWTLIQHAVSPVSVTGLASNTQYEFQVQAYCTLGWGPFSKSTKFKTLIFCVAPSGIKATGTTASSATISWSSVNSATSYLVQYRPAGTSSWLTKTSTSTSTTLSGLQSNTLYEYQVQASCPSGLSDFSPSNYVAIKAATCTDIYEPNDTKSSAKTISVFTAISATISTTDDLDYFKFSNTVSQPNIEVQLTNQPFNYALTLFDPSGTKLLTSNNSGTSDEVIKYNTSVVGTYTAEVYQPNDGASNTLCYSMFVLLSSSQFKLDGEHPASALERLLNVYPNPNDGSKINIDYQSEENADATLTVYNLNGQQMYSLQTGVTIGENHFSIDLDQPNAGMYLLVLTTNNKTARAEFVVAK